MRFKGKVAVVTGAGNGIGRGIAQRFAAEGASVALVDLDAAAAQAAVADIKAEGGTALAIAADAGDPASIRELVAQVVSDLGGIDVAVAGAGCGSSNVDFFELCDDEWNAVLRLNLTGPFVLGKALARHMLDSGRRGSIVHIASVGAELGVPTQAPYCVSKAGLVMLTKVMAVSLAPRGIRVNAIGPGPVKTAMTAQVRADATLSGLMLSRTPLGRFGEVDEIAGTALFLASDDAGFITGQTIYADGGRLALNYVMPPATD